MPSLLPSPIPSPERPPKKIKVEKEIQSDKQDRELCPCNNEEKTFNTAARKDLQSFISWITVTHRDIFLIPDNEKWCFILSDIKSRTLKMKNMLLNDAKRYRRMYRSSSENYESAIRSHINDVIMPYIHKLTFEI